MILEEIRAVSKPLARFEVVCHGCGRACAREGSCPGDAISELPCRAAERRSKAGLRLPTWKEMMLRDEGRYSLV